MASLPRLLVIVDSEMASARHLDVGDLAETLLDAGAPMLWLRDHHLSAHRSDRLLGRLRAHHPDTPIVSSSRGIPKNNRTHNHIGTHLSTRHLPDALRLIRHLRESDIPLVGASLHSGDDPTEPRLAPLDYATLSPLRQTPSKPGYGPPLGLSFIEEFARRAPFPVFALGGARPADAAALRWSHGLAVMGPLHVGTPKGPLRELLAALPPRATISRDADHA